MDDKAFRKHLAALVHGHHHPEEHDWAGEGRGKNGRTAKPAKKASRGAKGRSKKIKTLAAARPSH